MNEKQRVRREIRQKRRAFSNDKRIEGSREIASTLFLSDEYKNAKKVLTFISTRIEVDTSFIVSQALADGKTVAAPRCYPETNGMDFFVISGEDDLESGAFEILEPKSYCEKVEDLTDSICIVPGLSFDKSGTRIGFGRGFYDRFLARFDGISVGVCFEEFLSESLPSEPVDIPVDIVVTQQRIIRTK